ncbi:MAG: mechanosensitive ion channel [Deltaproteobacteria bacterium]|nr:mechanosensitive ion channel [Deltaproteobacteria bacterium]
MATRSPAVSLLLLVLLAAASPAAATEAGERLDAAPKAAGQEASPGAGLADLVPRSTDLFRRFSLLQSALTGKIDVAAQQKNVAAWQQRADRLAARLQTLKASGEARYDQLTELRAAAQDLTDSLQTLGDSLSAELARLGALQKAWADERTRWETWEAALPRGAPRAALSATFSEVHRTLQSAQQLLSSAAVPLVELQGRAGETQARTQAVGAEADRLLESLRGNLFRKTGPSLLSPEFWTTVRHALAPARWPRVAELGWPDQPFLASNAWIALLQLALSFLLWRSIRRRRALLQRSLRWSFLEKRPLAAALFVGFAAPSALYGTMPSTWSLLLWTIIAPAAARLVAGLISLPWKRRLLYGLASLLWLTQLLRVLGLPEPLFRVYVTVVAGAGLPLCLWRARESARRGDTPKYTWSLRLGAAVFAVVLLAQLGGFGALAVHLVEASLETTFLVLLAWVLALLVRGATELAGGGPHFQRLRLVRENTGSIVHRFGVLTDLLIGGLTLSFLLGVWRVFDGPLAAARGLLSLGVTLGGTSITVGLALAAAAVLYGAVLSSWTVQALLDEGTPLAAHIDIGVRMSVKRLVHYAFVLAGLVLALGTLGVELRNLAIVASALGVGIGFGLQNVVNNFVSGLILLFERPVKVGDVVQVAGEWGQIKRLGLRSTIIQTLDQSELIVPNSDLISNPVTNWTLSDRQSRIVVPVGVAYGSDVTRVMGTLTGVAANHPSVLPEPAPQVLFTGFGASSLDFELRAWVGEVAERLVIRSALLQAIDQRFREEGIEIPFPQRDLHLRSVDTPAADALGRRATRSGSSEEEP